MEFRILGPLEVVVDGRVLAIPAGRQRALLALLIVNAGRVLSTDRIVEGLWGDEPPAGAAKALGFHVSRLRDALDPGRVRGGTDHVLATVPGGYLLRAEDAQIDARRCERLAAEGRALLRTDPAAAAARFAEALALWRGDPLEGLADEPFAPPALALLEELRLRLLEDRFEAELALGHNEEVIGELGRAVAANPLREQLRGQLMTALYRSGRQAEALRVYEDGRRILAEELGIDPSPSLQRLQVSILRHDAGLERPEAAPPPRNPYKGLRAFDEADSPDFFGREALTRRLVERLAEVARAGGLLTLVGPSGSGKSSVIRAGLVPALRAGALPGSERWPIAVMFPGGRPFEALSAALRAAAPDASPAVPGQVEGGEELARLAGRIAGDAGGRLLLVIDQFEELFLLTAEAARSRFLRCLVRALAVPGSSLLVVTTLRADRLDRPLLSSDLGELLRGGLEVVTPLRQDELERAIASPAEGVGMEVEPGLAAEIAAGLVQRPAALPLLEYAMTELFEHRAGRHLTREAYDAIGGAPGALGRRAEETWQGLDPADRETARQALLRLVGLENRSEPTVRRVPRAELEPSREERERVDRVIDAFVQRRLLSFDRDPVTGAATVEVAHEALLSHWPRLAGWVDEERQAISMRSRLGEAAAEWVAAGQDPGFLLAGARLDLFRSWAASTDLRLNESERALLASSLAEARRDEEQERARAAHERSLERRAATRLRALVAVFGVAALVATTLSVAVLRQSQAAGEERAVATAKKLAASSVGRLASDPQLSLLLAVQAAEATLDRGFVVDDAMYALHWALQEDRVAYPVGSGTVATGPAPGGPRGIFLLPLDQLIRLAIAHAGRALTAEECLAYLDMAACPAPPATPGAGQQLAVYTTEKGRVPIAELASGTVAGTSVRVASEVPADLAPLLAPFEQDQGIQVAWDGGRPADVAALVAGGTLPDVALVSAPGLVASLARQGQLVDLGGYLDVARLRSAGGDYLADLGTVDPSGAWPTTSGRLYGVPVAISSGSLIWYPVAAFQAAGYRVPATWAELMALSRQMVADGRTPWCLGTEAGASSGRSLADWVAELILHQEGTAFYDAWSSGSESFESPRVGAAFETLGEIVFGHSFVLNGAGSVAHISPGMAALPMQLDPPGCWLDAATTAERGAWGKGLRDLTGAFPLPDPAPTSSPPVLGQVYMAVVFRDRPEVRRLVAYLTGDSFAAALASSAGSSGLFAARSRPAGARAGGEVAIIGQGLAAALAAGRFRVDASDLMPRAVAASFDRGMLLFLSAQVDRAQVLAGIEASWYPPGG